MKILFILKGPFGRLGSTDQFMIPQTLEKMGCAVSILSFHETKMSIAPTVVAKNLKIPLKEIQYKNLLQKLDLINREIKYFKPDIIHVFPQMYYYLFPFLKIIRPFKKTKWIIDFRSPPLYAKKRHWFKESTDFLRQIGYDVILTHETTSAVKTLKYIFKPLYEVPPGIETRAIQYKKYPDKIVKIKKFIYIGSIAKFRRLDLLLKGIKKALAISSERFTVDFYGDGDVLPNLKTMVKKWDLSDAIRFKGALPQEILYKKLSQYTAGISYIPYEQYFYAPALKTLEYMAAGLFVIASDTAGNKKFIQDGVNGVLFRNTEDSIAQTITKAVEEGLPVKYIEKAYLIAKKYDWELIVKDRLLPVYKKLLTT